MRASVVLLSVLLAAGCGSPSAMLVPERLPTPIGDVYLPVYPSEVPSSVRMSVRALIAADGSVQSAEISPRSGNDLWDSLAAEAIKGWRFSPATQNDRPVPAWVRFPVTLRFADPHPITLAEIVVPTREAADSIYALLQQGGDFRSLARAHSLSSTAVAEGYIGPLQLRGFPVHVQMAITSVGTGQVTRPVAVGGLYTIFKRLQEEGSVPATRSPHR
jgi:TonB family protein